jgi:uncharacterized protein (TIGR02391 family)
MPRDIVPQFKNPVLEQLSRALAEAVTGSDISRVLHEYQLEEIGGNASTKWVRLLDVFKFIQASDQNSNRVLAMTSELMAPARFVGRNDDFEHHRQELNRILAFAGLELRETGAFGRREMVRTLAEAEARLHTIQRKFQGRRIHPEVLKYCRTELLQDNYFHAVFEATKGLSQRIREMSGVDADGAELVDTVFPSKMPILAINTMQTQSERSEHIGFAMLIKGCVGAIRNPMAHTPKILWEGEDDAVDYLTLLSLVHRKLDDAVKTRK